MLGPDGVRPDVTMAGTVAKAIGPNAAMAMPGSPATFSGLGAGWTEPNPANALGYVMVRAGAGATNVVALDFLPRDGRDAMRGALNLGGNNVTSVNQLGAQGGGFVTLSSNIAQATGNFTGQSGNVTGGGGFTAQNGMFGSGSAGSVAANGINAGTVTAATASASSGTITTLNGSRMVVPSFVGNLRGNGKGTWYGEAASVFCSNVFGGSRYLCVPRVVTPVTVTPPTESNTAPSGCVSPFSGRTYAPNLLACENYGSMTSRSCQLYQTQACAFCQSDGTWLANSGFFQEKPAGNDTSGSCVTCSYGGQNFAVGPQTLTFVTNNPAPQCDAVDTTYYADCANVSGAGTWQNVRATQLSRGPNSSSALGCSACATPPCGPTNQFCSVPDAPGGILSIGSTFDRKNGPEYPEKVPNPTRMCQDYDRDLCSQPPTATTFQRASTDCYNCPVGQIATAQGCQTITRQCTNERTRQLYTGTLTLLNDITGNITRNDGSVCSTSTTFTCNPTTAQESRGAPFIVNPATDCSAPPAACSSKVPGFINGNASETCVVNIVNMLSTFGLGLDNSVQVTPALKEPVVTAGFLGQPVSAHRIQCTAQANYATLAETSCTGGISQGSNCVATGNYGGWTPVALVYDVLYGESGTATPNGSQVDRASAESMCAVALNNGSNFTDPYLAAAVTPLAGTLAQFISGQGNFTPNIQGAYPSNVPAGPCGNYSEAFQLTSCGNGLKPL